MQERKHKNKKHQQRCSVYNGPQIAELANQVRDLKEIVNILILQIQMLRSEVKKTSESFQK
jgi:hypothetical protein